MKVRRVEGPERRYGSSERVQYRPSRRTVRLLDGLVFRDALLFGHEVQECGALPGFDRLRRGAYRQTPGLLELIGDLERGALASASVRNAAFTFSPSKVAALGFSIGAADTSVLGLCLRISLPKPSEYR